MILSRKLLLLFFVVSVIFSCNKSIISENESSGFTLKGKTNGLKDETMILLVDVLSNKTIDSTVIKNNAFEFKGILENSPSQVVVHTKDFSQYEYIWLENKSMIFDASKTNFKKAIITGSKIQDLASQLYDQIDTIVNPYKVQEIEMRFVEEHPNSIISASLLSFYSTTWERSKVEDLFNHFTEENKESSFGKEIQSFLELNKNPQLGEKYIDFEMENEHGNKVRLSEKLGKLTLIEFWSSNCGPCRAKNPNLVKTYNYFNTKGFEIIAVSLDSNKEDWKDAIRKDKLPWIHVSDLKGRLNKASLIYGINTVPDNFLLDEKGIIIGRNLRGEDLKSRLKEYVEKKAS